MGYRNPIEDLRAYARALVADAAIVAVPMPIAVPVRSSLPLRRIAALAVIGVLVVGTAGVAAGADSANPGDLLYPVDRSVEQVGSWLGLRQDSVAERAAEASVLLGRGDVVQALETARESALTGADKNMRAVVEQALDDAITTARGATDVPRAILHIAIGQLIAAARNASDAEPGSVAVVAAAHNVAAVARGGSGGAQGEAVGRSGDPSLESPQPRGGSSSSETPGGSHKGLRP